MIVQGSKSMTQRARIPIYEGDFRHLVSCLVEDMTEAERAEYFELTRLVMRLPERTLHAFFAFYLALREEKGGTPHWVN